MESHPHSPRSNIDDCPKPKQNVVQERYKDSFSCAYLKPEFIDG